MSETLTGQGSTILNLLTRDGAVTVTFEGYLTGEQYAKLYDCIRDYSETRQELTERIAMVANEWGIKAIVDAG